MIETWWQLLKAVELAVLALAPWPFYRALAIPSFKRFYLCFAVSVGVILVTYAVTIIVIALVLPALLHLIALLALAVLLLERLRARESYGQGRRLPPGSLALVPRTPWVDHRFYLKRAAQHGPVFKTSLFFRPMVCVVGADLGYALLQEHGDALRAPPVRFNRFIPRGFLRYMEGEDHLRYRKLFQLGIAPAVLKSSASAIESQVREALKRIADVSAPRGDQGINPRAAIREMMLSILLRLFFGITEDNERSRRLSELYERIDVRKAACGSAKSEIRVAREIAATIKQQADSLLNSSAEDKPATASFLAEILRRDPNTAEDDCVLLNLVYMVQVARGDMTGLLMWVLKKMSDNHEVVDELRDISSNPSEASQSAASELSAAIVKETLRLDQSEFLYRKAQDEIRFKGFVIPWGSPGLPGGYLCVETPGRTSRVAGRSPPRPLGLL